MLVCYLKVVIRGVTWQMYVTKQNNASYVLVHHLTSVHFQLAFKRPFMGHIRSKTIFISR